MSNSKIYIYLNTLICLTFLLSCDFTQKSERKGINSESHGQKEINILAFKINAAFGYMNLSAFKNHKQSKELKLRFKAIKKACKLQAFLSLSFYIVDGYIKRYVINFLI